MLKCVVLDKWNERYMLVDFCAAVLPDLPVFGILIGMWATRQLEILEN